MLPASCKCPHSYILVQRALNAKAKLILAKEESHFNRSQKLNMCQYELISNKPRPVAAMIYSGLAAQHGKTKAML